MGDYHVSTNEEALGDLWLLENHSINPYIELNDFRPIVDQISSSIDENEFSKEKATSNINDQPQERNFPTNPSNIVFVESQECILLHNNNYETNFDSKYSNVAISEQVKTPSKGGTGKGFRSSKTKKRKVPEIENFESENREIIPPVIVEGESLAKKRDHNAKERMRRLKLHTTYLALGSLLRPTSRTSKKKWTAPVIIDKVLDYIPELESEIEQLTHKKNKIITALNANKRTKTTKDISDGNKSSDNYTNNTTKAKVDHALTVSVNEAKQGEFILQICKTRDESKVDSFSNLLQNIEREKNLHVLSASTLFVCDERECYSIHIQMNESTTSSSTNGCDYITSIKEKFISWLS